MRRLAPALSLALMLASLMPANLAFAQEGTTTLGDAEADIVHSADGVEVLRVQGPDVNARTQSFGQDIHLQWYVVQDSSLGLVFREPSGLKIDNNRGYDADIDLKALEPVEAFEVKALTFNVWDEHAGTFRTTYRASFATKGENSFDPRWADLRDEGHRHLTSIIYISRVRHPDGSVSMANTDPVHHVAQQIDDSYKPAAEREEDLEDLLELWREFLKRLQGWTPPGSVTSGLGVDEASAGIN